MSRSKAPYTRPADEQALADCMARIASAGDRQSFRLVFEALAPVVKGLALRQGADRAMAEEVVQDTFVAVWRRAAQYSRERGTVAAWVFTIARNARIDRLRREPAWQELTDEQAELASDDPAPDDILDARQIQTQVRGVLTTLPPEQAAVIRLAYVEGLSHSAIATALGVPIGTVKTRMNLAYQKIRSALKERQ